MKHARRVLAACGIVGAVAAATISPATAVPLDVPAPSNPIVGTVGVLNTPYTYEAGWNKFDGKLKSNMAVATFDGVTHMLGTGTNDRLYHRTATTPWRAIAPVGFKCTSLAAGVDWMGMVQVGCVGYNGSFYTFSFDATETAPSLAAGDWVKVTSAGVGTISAVSATVVDGTVRFTAKGAEDPEFGYNQFTWNGEAWEEYLSASCTTTAAWVDVATDGTYAVCGALNDDGSQGIWIDTPTGTGMVAGKTNQTPAVAVVDDSTVRIFIQGLNGKLYSMDVVDGVPTQTWTNLGGNIMNGVTAASTYVAPMLPPLDAGTGGTGDTVVTPPADGVVIAPPGGTTGTVADPTVTDPGLVTVNPTIGDLTLVTGTVLVPGTEVFIDPGTAVDTPITASVASPSTGRT